MASPGASSVGMHWLSVDDEFDDEVDGRSVLTMDAHGMVSRSNTFYFYIHFTRFSLHFVGP